MSEDLNEFKSDKKFDNIKDKSEYSYYSNILKKPFNTLDELHTAEANEKARLEKKEAVVSARKEAATKVEEAYKAWRAASKTYYDARAERAEKYFKDQAVLKKAYQEDLEALSDPVDEAEDAYHEALNAFTKKYGAFHATFKDGDETITLTNRVSRVNDFFDNFLDFIGNW